MNFGLSVGVCRTESCLNGDWYKFIGSLSVIGLSGTTEEDMVWLMGISSGGGLFGWLWKFSLGKGGSAVAEVKTGSGGSRLDP